MILKVICILSKCEKDFTVVGSRNDKPVVLARYHKNDGRLKGPTWGGAFRPENISEPAI